MALASICSPFLHFVFIVGKSACTKWLFRFSLDNWRSCLVPCRSVRILVRLSTSNGSQQNVSCIIIYLFPQISMRLDQMTNTLCHYFIFCVRMAAAAAVLATYQWTKQMSRVIKFASLRTSVYMPIDKQQSLAVQKLNIVHRNRILSELNPQKKRKWFRLQRRRTWRSALSLFECVFAWRHPSACLNSISAFRVAFYAVVGRPAR